MVSILKIYFSMSLLFFLEQEEGLALNSSYSVVPMRLSEPVCVGRGGEMRQGETGS